MTKTPLAVVLALLLLKATASPAQAPPAAPPPAAGSQPVSVPVSVPVPRALLLLTDVVSVLVSRNEGQGKVQALVDRRRERSKKGAQTIDFTVPNNKLTRALGLAE